MNKRVGNIILIIDSNLTILFWNSVQLEQVRWEKKLDKCEIINKIYT